MARLMLMLGLMFLMGCSVPLTAEMLQALRDDPASVCIMANVHGGAGSAAFVPVPVPAGGYGAANLVICRANEPGSKIVLTPEGMLTIEHGKAKE